MTEPYYQDDSVTLYHGDCLEITEWLTADVLVTDPPYGTEALPGNPRGGYGRRQDKQGRGSVHAPGVDGFGAWIAGDNDTSVRDEALSVWQFRGPVLIFGSPRLADPPGEWADRLVWDKKRPGMNGGPWRYRHESIFVSAGFLRSSNAAVSIIEAFPEQADHIHGKPIALYSG